jgi:hypothetical protein
MTGARAGKPICGHEKERNISMSESVSGSGNHSYPNLNDAINKHNSNSNRTNTSEAIQKGNTEKVKQKYLEVASRHNPRYDDDPNVRVISPAEETVQNISERVSREEMQDTNITQRNRQNINSENPSASGPVVSNVNAIESLESIFNDQNNEYTRDNQDNNNRRSAMPSVLISDAGRPVTTRSSFGSFFSRSSLASFFRTSRGDASRAPQQSARAPQQSERSQAYRRTERLPQFPNQAWIDETDPVALARDLRKVESDGIENWNVSGVTPVVPDRNILARNFYNPNDAVQSAGVVSPSPAGRASSTTFQERNPRISTALPFFARVADSNLGEVPNYTLFTVGSLFAIPMDLALAIPRLIFHGVSFVASSAYRWYMGK